jgi:hypothetical protein
MDEKTVELLEASKSVLFWWDNEDKESIRQTEKRFDKLKGAIENLDKIKEV